MKRIVTIQDISCHGKCSLTVALPIISAMGIETCIIPTAILSTHTGGFSNYTWRDLTDDIAPIAKHWKSIGLKFDAIYTGYLGSPDQIALVSDFFDDFSDKGTIKFVDPVMGDNGKLYTGFTPDFASKMAGLCAKADIIVPNLTEASYMLNKEYISGGYTEEYIKETLVELTGLGCKTAVITGVSYGDGKQGAALYDSASGEYCSYFRENIDAKYHGTGDIFSSTLCGALTLGKSPEEALKTAVDYTVECIKKTIGDENHKYGVKFEECIPYLIRSIGK